ncbi:GNAT family N-acetyltransferase [Cognatishimia activa]|uniref:Putative N-acetyltransferase YjcF n=1 Tax=Cognatishimia activa TaxID=1715691 RepID=A0A0P1IM14_9RHOB|nr:GNAT family N-acetyltransferase [Cognatishimia activa]CUI34431.1 putative N-acetyltransferase YjcF [Cognatishimia activa]CUK24687.1 putative N-acetyltransferase YjcF [Cognatishimia activa]
MSWEIFQTDDIAACVALRREVFIVEQGIAEEDEIDDLDDEAIHILASVDGTPVGTARLLIAGTTGKIGRICVLKSQRGTGLGAALVQFGAQHLKERGDLTRIALGAQEYAIGFYEKLGFKVCGPIYDDAGIPHRDMEILL